MSLHAAAAAASQLLLVPGEEGEILCSGCSHPDHSAACREAVVLAQGPLRYGLTYVATGLCPCPYPATAEIH